MVLRSVSPAQREPEGHSQEDSGPSPCVRKNPGLLAVGWGRAAQLAGVGSLRPRRAGVVPGPGCRGATSPGGGSDLPITAGVHGAGGRSPLWR